MYGKAYRCFVRASCSTLYHFVFVAGNVADIVASHFVTQNLATTGRMKWCSGTETAESTAAMEQKSSSLVEIISAEREDAVMVQ